MGMREGSITCLWQKPPLDAYRYFFNQEQREQKHGKRRKHPEPVNAPFPQHDFHHRLVKQKQFEGISSYERKDAEQCGFAILQKRKKVEGGVWNQHDRIYDRRHERRKQRPVFPILRESDSETEIAQRKLGSKKPSRPRKPCPRP